MKDTWMNKVRCNKALKEAVEAHMKQSGESYTQFITNAIQKYLVPTTTNVPTEAVPTKQNVPTAAIKILMEEYNKKGKLYESVQKKLATGD